MKIIILSKILRAIFYPHFLVDNYYKYGRLTITMARPSKKDQHLYHLRDKLIIKLLKKYSQADVARIFARPRNTICVVNKKHNNGQTNN